MERGGQDLGKPRGATSSASDRDTCCLLPGWKGGQRGSCRRCSRVMGLSQETLQEGPVASTHHFDLLLLESAGLPVVPLPALEPLVGVVSAAPHTALPDP